MSDFVSVHPDGVIDPARIAIARRILNKRAIPALRRVLGPGLVLPRHVVLRPPGPDGWPLDEAGTVPVVWDGDRIVEVHPPQVVVVSNDEILRSTLVHELAHFHDLSTRKARRLWIPDDDVRWLWSEYFAERVTHLTGYGLHCMKKQPPPRPAPTAEGNAPTTAPPRMRLGVAYKITHTRAHADAVSMEAAVGGWGPDHPEIVRRWLEEWFGRKEDIDRLFGSFPRWAEDDFAVLAGFFSEAIDQGE